MLTLTLANGSEVVYIYISVTFLQNGPKPKCRGTSFENLPKRERALLLRLRAKSTSLLFGSPQIWPSANKSKRIYKLERIYKLASSIRKSESKKFNIRSLSLFPTSSLKELTANGSAPNEDATAALFWGPLRGKF